MAPAEAISTGQVVCPTKSGFFECGYGEICDRAIQACDRKGDTCEWYGSLSGDASCGACPSCDCLLAGRLAGASCGCSEDDAGSVTLSCGPCYGAPPARLERIA